MTSVKVGAMGGGRAAAMPRVVEKTIQEYSTSASTFRAPTDAWTRKVLAGTKYGTGPVPGQKVSPLDLWLDGYWGDAIELWYREIDLRAKSIASQYVAEIYFTVWGLPEDPETVTQRLDAARGGIIRKMGASPTFGPTAPPSGPIPF